MEHEPPTDIAIRFARDELFAETGRMVAESRAKDFTELMLGCLPQYKWMTTVLQLI